MAPISTQKHCKNTLSTVENTIGNEPLTSAVTVHGDVPSPGDTSGTQKTARLTGFRDCRFIDGITKAVNRNQLGVHH